MFTRKVAADQSTSVVALAPITDLAVVLAGNTSYDLDYFLTITSAATTTGFQFGFTGPASPAVALHGVLEYQSSATAWTLQTLTGYTAGTLVTAAYAASTPIVVRVRATITTGAVGGTLALNVRSEVAGSAVTVKRGSSLKVT